MARAQRTTQSICFRLARCESSRERKRSLKPKIKTRVNASLKHVKKLLFLALIVFLSVTPAALAIDTIKPGLGVRGVGVGVGVDLGGV